MTRQRDGTLEFRRPGGQVLPEVPSLPAVPEDPFGVLRARHQAEGLTLHARTTCAEWLGGAT